jgi:hypothetical protein
VDRAAAHVRGSFRSMQELLDRQNTMYIGHGVTMSLQPLELAFDELAQCRSDVQLMSS